MTAFIIGIGSPEQGWQPFLDWLLAQGIEPTDTRAITIDPETMAANVTLIKRVHGQAYVEDGDIATKQQQVKITSLPPRRPPDDREPPRWWPVP